MQVNSVTMNKQSSFKGGISANLYTKIAGKKFMSDVYTKAAEIKKANNDVFFLSDAVYNAKEKSAEFVLSAADIIKYIPGLEKVKSITVKSSGENLKDAFINIDTKDLIKANNTLAANYKTEYSQTAQYREQILAQRESVQKELKEKFENADGFWNCYYKSINKK